MDLRTCRPDGADKVLTGLMGCGRVPREHPRVPQEHVTAFALCGTRPPFGAEASTRWRQYIGAVVRFGFIVLRTFAQFRRPREIEQI
jgi:hypothetical protein